jgi:tRNA(Arg) A34 adenosine deaminase TadA
MHRAVELAWESFRAGSLGIGAVITRDGETLATGRNRLAESDPGEVVLAGTSLAHAELNALAKLRWGSPWPTSPP